MKGNCETCRHWEGAGWLVENWGVCAMSRTLDGEKLKPKSLAYATAMFGESGVLRTHVTFGCIQWEPKEK